jgi:1,4-dihydroxy-2-naphthoyl-CoA hydrolase
MASMPLRPEAIVEALLRRAQAGLPGLLGLQVVDVTASALQMRLPIEPKLLAPNGYLHAASVIGLADTVCGFACMVNLPPGAHSFTTIELKANFLGTATEGSLVATARPIHRGRTTQVWDASVSHVESGRSIAEFRCTQLVLWPKADRQEATG